MYSYSFSMNIKWQWDFKMGQTCGSTLRISWPRYDQFNPSSYPHPRTNSRTPWWVIVQERGSNHVEQSRVINNRRSSSWCLEGTTGFHIASQMDNQAWTWYKYPSFTNSINHGLEHIHIKFAPFSDVNIRITHDDFSERALNLYKKLSLYPQAPNLCPEAVVDYVRKSQISIQCPCLIAPMYGY